MNKTIIMVGVLDVKGSTNISQAKAFTQLGYDVIPINYRTIIRNRGHNFFYDLLLDVTKHYSPELVMFCKCNGINPDIVKRCSDLATTWLWNPDPIQTIERCPEVLQHARNANFSSCTGKSVVDWFKSNGVQNCNHVFEGIDPKLYTFLDREKTVDFSFIGTKLPLRDEYKIILEEAGYTTAFYGDGYEKTAHSGKEFSEVCAASRYMLSINTQNNLPDYFSDRLFRYLSCGSCVFHFDTTNTVYKYFKDGKEVILFKNKEELLAKIKEVHSAGNSIEMGKAGRDRVINNYTWEHSATNVLNTISNKIESGFIDLEVK